MASATYSLLTRNSLSDARRRRRSLISLTPLIDVVFILLIFFMLASSFSTEEAIELSMPGSGAAEGALPGSMVRIKRDGLDLNGEPLTLDELQLRARRLARAPGGRLFLVQPDRGVPLQRLVVVLDALDRAGASNVSLVRK
jgi:biopolymer transport protein ExbD